MSKEFDEFCEECQNMTDYCASYRGCERAFLAGQESIENNITRIKKDLVETERFYEKKMGELEKENNELKEQIEKMRNWNNCLHNKVCGIKNVCPDYCTNWKLKEGGE